MPVGPPSWICTVGSAVVKVPARLVRISGSELWCSTKVPHASRMRSASSPSPCTLCDANTTATLKPRSRSINPATWLEDEVIAENSSTSAGS